MKKVKTLLLLSILFLGACTATTQEYEPNKNVCTDECEPSDMSDYKLLDDPNPVFLDMTWTQALERLEGTSFTGIIYFGFSDCPWCKEAVPIMNEVAKEAGQSIYYVNRESKENLELTQDKAKVTDVLNQAFKLDVDKDGNPKIFVPEVIVVKDGKIVDHHLGTLEEHDATKRTMNEDEVKQLTEIYTKLFAKAKE